MDKANVQEVKKGAEVIAQWRFDALRKAMVHAAHLAAGLVRDEEEGNYFSEDEKYHATMELLSVLASGLREGVQP